MTPDPARPRTQLRSRPWLRETDIVVATYPKCGTTWMQNILLCLLAGGDASKVRDPMKMSRWPEAEKHHEL